LSAHLVALASSGKQQIIAATAIHKPTQPDGNKAGSGWT